MLPDQCYFISYRELSVATYQLKLTLPVLSSSSITNNLARTSYHSIGLRAADSFLIFWFAQVKDNFERRSSFAYHYQRSSGNKATFSWVHFSRCVGIQARY